MEYIHLTNKHLKFNFEKKIYLEACSQYEILKRSIPNLSTDYIFAKAAQLTTLHNFQSSPFDCVFYVTDDGYQIGNGNALPTDPDYCIVYVSFDKIYYGKNQIKSPKDQIELWHFINEALIEFYFSN